MKTHLHSFMTRGFNPTRSEDMPEACPYSNGALPFPLRALRVPSWTNNAERESGATAYTGASRPMP
jgi:hypothetical protein